VVKQCITINKFPKISKTSTPDVKQKDNQFVSITVVKATILFTSTWENNLKTPSTIPKLDSIRIKNTPNIELHITKLFIKPQTPNFTKKPLK